MKKLISLLFLVVIFYSCKTELDVNPEPELGEDLSINTPSLEKDYLVFDNPIVFFKMMPDMKSDLVKNGDSWQKIQGFISLQEDYFDKRGTKEFNRSTELDITMPFLSKIVNPQGIVRIGNSLFLFSKKYTKIIPNFRGTDKEIATLINAKESNGKNLIVKEAETFSLTKASKNSRIGNFFETNEDYLRRLGASSGNIGASVVCKVWGTQVNVPIYCWTDPDAEASSRISSEPVWGFCRWDSYFIVLADGYIYDNTRGIFANSYLNYSLNMDGNNLSGAIMANHDAGGRVIGVSYTAIPIDVTGTVTSFISSSAPITFYFSQNGLQQRFDDGYGSCSVNL